MSEIQPAQPAPAANQGPEIDALCAALAAAADVSVSTIYGEVALTEAIHSGDFNIWASGVERLDTLGRKVVELVMSDDRFPKNAQFQLRSPGGDLPFYPTQVGTYLIRRTMDCGSPGEAIGWLLRILQAQNASGRIVEALWGVPVAEEIELRENLSIWPVTSLKDGPFKMLLLGQHQGIKDDLVLSPLTMVFPRSVLAFRTELTRVIAPVGATDLPPALSQATANAIEEQMQEITDLLTVVGPRVALSAAITFEFDDPDLHYLGSLLLGRRARLVEVMPLRPTSFHPVLDPIEARELVAIFTELPQTLRKRLRVALNRLSLAQRRFKMGDKAIDLAIALESLLGGNENNEVTHKVTTRAAHLLGGTNGQRLRNRDVVHATYGYRSKMVHNGEEPSGNKTIDGELMSANEIIDAAVGVCVEVIKKIIRLRGIPDWKPFDIQQG